MIEYDRLWESMKQKNISQNALIRDHGISAAQLTRLRKNQVVYTSTLDRICSILHCKIEDVIEFIDNDK